MRIARVSVLVVAQLLVACTGTGERFEAPASAPGRVRMFLEPNDEQGVCYLTAELTNLSNDRRGEGVLELEMLDAAGARLGAARLALDPLLPGRVGAKGQPVPGRCSAIGRIGIRSAQWYPYPDREIEDETVYVIEGVAGTNWQPRWDPARGLFAGGAVID